MKRYDEIAKDMRKWFEEAEHYSVVHYAIERGMSKEIRPNRFNCTKIAIALNADSIKALIGNFINFGNSYLSRKEI